VCVCASSGALNLKFDKFLRINLDKSTKGLNTTMHHHLIRKTGFLATIPQDQVFVVLLVSRSIRHCPQLLFLIISDTFIVFSEKNNNFPVSSVPLFGATTRR
jgi:hypothetical protein